MQRHKPRKTFSIPRAAKQLGPLMAVCLIVAPIARAGQSGSLGIAVGPAQCGPVSHAAQQCAAAPRGLYRWCELPGSKVGEVETDLTIQSDPPQLGAPRLDAASAACLMPIASGECGTLRACTFAGKI